MKGYGKYSLRKESVIASVIEWLTARESSSWILYAQLCLQFAQSFHFSLPLAERIDYQQGALQKELVTAPFIERFKIDESIKL